MLKKKTKKSYGAFNDSFLSECRVVSRMFEVTHIHLKEYGSFLAGIYSYEPRTGILKDLDDQHIGILKNRTIVKASQEGKAIFLKHKSSWEEMVEKGLVKADNEDDLKWFKDKENEVQAATPQPEKNSGTFLKKLLNKK